MADFANTLVGLWDVAVRVATFANDLRAAQDDFIGLRAEAECLLICINSLNASSFRDVLYRYINAQQAADLKAIVKNTTLNMVELNQFIAKCWRLVERRVGGNVRLKGWRGVPRRLKEAVAKAWATYRFTMKDKQAFRDKLMLPAQSLNIYLTTLTHVGLVNVGFLIQLSGHGGGGGGGGGGRGGGRGGGDYGGWHQEDRGGGMAMASPVDGWGAVGRRVAFKDSIVDESELTPDIEEQLVMYALYLARGGTPFLVQSSSGGIEWEPSRVSKTTKTRTRSRSRSAAPVGLGRGNKGQLLLVRKKSFHNPSTERIENVDREYGSGWESAGHAGRRRLALPAPDSSPSDIQYMEIRPSTTSS